MPFGIGAPDLIVIVVYLVGIVGLGCWVGLPHRRQGGESEDYFLAGGSLSWPVIGLALFSTNISTIHLVSLAQEGYANGLAFGNFELMAGFMLIVLALFFAPFYIRSRVATMFAVDVSAPASHGCARHASTDSLLSTSTVSMPVMRSFACALTSPQSATGNS